MCSVARRGACRRDRSRDRDFAGHIVPVEGSGPCRCWSPRGHSEPGSRRLASAKKRTAALEAELRLIRDACELFDDQTVVSPKADHGRRRTDRAWIFAALGVPGCRCVPLDFPAATAATDVLLSGAVLGLSRPGTDAHHPATGLVTEARGVGMDGRPPVRGSAQFVAVAAAGAAGGATSFHRATPAPPPRKRRAVVRIRSGTPAPESAGKAPVAPGAAWGEPVGGQ